jgi:hypothetical protein
VYCSIGTVAVRVTAALSLPPTDAGLVYPLPEFIKGITDKVAVGFVVVEPLKVKSGSILRINTKLCPSSISVSELVIYEYMAAGVAVVLSSTPFS